MKSCPTCHRTYEDDAMSFCLEDGTPLASASESSYDPGATIRIPSPRVTSDSPTEVLAGGTSVPTQASPPDIRPASPVPAQKYDAAATPPASDGRKSNAAPWILVAALVLGLSAIVVAVILTRGGGTDNSQVAQTNQTANTSPSVNSSPSNELGGETTDDRGMNPTASPATTPAGESPAKTPAGKTPEQPTPTPKPTQTPKPTPETTPPPPPRPSGPISGGVLNGKAISKPAPPYPAVAKAARASGTVTVQVTVDENGKVISARAVSGHPLLQQSAVQAAYQARFAPTLLSGQPVKVTGVITYNYTLQ